MSEVLYRRVMRGKRTTYEPVTTKVLPDIQIETGEVVSLLGTLVVSLCSMMSEQLQLSSILCRKIKNVNKELIELVRVGFVKPTPVLVDVGVNAWNAAVRAIQNSFVEVKR